MLIEFGLFFTSQTPKFVHLALPHPQQTRNKTRHNRILIAPYQYILFIAYSSLLSPPLPPNPNLPLTPPNAPRFPRLVLLPPLFGVFVTSLGGMEEEGGKRKRREVEGKAQINAFPGSRWGSILAVHLRDGLILRGLIHFGARRDLLRRWGRFFECFIR